MKNCYIKCTNNSMRAICWEENKIYYINKNGFVIKNGEEINDFSKYNTLDDVSLAYDVIFEMATPKEILLHLIEEAKKENKIIVVEDDFGSDPIGYVIINNLNDVKIKFNRSVLDLDDYNDDLEFYSIKTNKIYKFQKPFILGDEVWNKEPLWEKPSDDDLSDCKDQEDIDIQDEHDHEVSFEINNQEYSFEAITKTPKQILLDTVKNNIAIVSTEYDGCIEYGIIVNNAILFQDSSNKLDEFDDDLNAIDIIDNTPEYFISKIYKVNGNFNNYFGFDGLFEDENEDFLETIWEKDAKINLSRQEIANKLGIDVNKLNIID